MAAFVFPFGSFCQVYHSRLFHSLGSTESICESLKSSGKIPFGALEYPDLVKVAESSTLKSSVLNHPPDMSFRVGREYDNIFKAGGFSWSLFHENLLW